MESVRVSISNYAKTYKRELTQEEIDKGYYKRNWKFDQETTNYLEITICNSYGRDPSFTLEGLCCIWGYGHMNYFYTSEHSGFLSSASMAE